MKKQYRFYRKIIQFWLLPKEPFTHVSLQVYSQKLSLIWCILQILHGFWADVDSTAKIQPPTEYWTKKKKEIWDITVLQTNRPTIAYNQRALKESHSTLTIPSRYFSVGHTELSCFGPPCSPTNLWPGFLGQPQARLWGWSTGLLLWTSSTTSWASITNGAPFWAAGSTNHQAFSAVGSEICSSPVSACNPQRDVKKGRKNSQPPSRNFTVKDSACRPPPWMCCGAFFHENSHKKHGRGAPSNKAYRPHWKEKAITVRSVQGGWSCRLERLQRTSCGSPAESRWLLIDHWGWKWTPKATEC